MCLWVIDDNSLHLALIEAICREDNIKYKMFSSSKELLRFIEKREDISPEPSVILIDLVLEEGKRGEEILRKLKDFFKGTKTKFVAFTGDIINKSNLLSIGFDEVIYKPLTKEKLELLIKEYLYGV